MVLEIFKESLLFNIALIIVFATLIGLVAYKLKQSVMLSYIIAGILLGPLVLKLVDYNETLEAFSSFGVAFLLFIVGLNLNFKVFKEVGKVSLVTGIGQVLFTAIVGFFIAKALGFSSIVSIYISIGLAFSSTIIIVKLLTDKGDIDTLYGRISIGFLIVQDFIAIFALIFITGTTLKGNLSSLLGITILKGVILLLFVFLFSRYVIRNLFDRIANSQEMIFMCSITWCFVTAALSHILGFSVEMGAFLAGISLSGLTYTLDIVSMIRPLRDFFVVLFFVSLGLKMVLIKSSALIWPALIFSLFVIIGNPLILMSFMGILGYRKRTSFLCGLTVAQISEFSLILAALGLKVGHLNNDVLSIMTLVAIITMGASAYIVKEGDRIYNKLAKYLEIFERKRTIENTSTFKKAKKYNIVLFGGHRIGRTIIEKLMNKRKEILVIDFNPQVLKLLKNKKVDVLYGDAFNLDIINDVNWKKIKIAVSTIQNKEDNLFIIDNIKKKNNKVKVVVTTVHMDEADDFYKAGADFVILPYMISGEKVSEIIKKGIKSERFWNKAIKDELGKIHSNFIQELQLTK